MGREIPVDASGERFAAADRRLDRDHVHFAGPGDMDANFPDAVVVFRLVGHADILAPGDFRIVGPGDFGREVRRDGYLPPQRVARALADDQFAPLLQQEFALPTRTVERPQSEALPAQLQGRLAPAAVELQEDLRVLGRHDRFAVMRQREHTRRLAGIVRRGKPGFDRHRIGRAALEVRQERPDETVGRIVPADGETQNQQNDGEAPQGIGIAPGDPRLRRADAETLERRPRPVPVTLPDRFGEGVAGPDGKPVPARGERPVREAAGPLQAPPGGLGAGQAQAQETVAKGKGEDEGE